MVLTLESKFVDTNKNFVFFVGGESFFLCLKMLLFFFIEKIINYFNFFKLHLKIKKSLSIIIINISK